MKVISAVYMSSTTVHMTVDDEEEEWLESGTSRVSICGLQREDEERQLQRRPRKELNS